MDIAIVTGPFLSVPPAPCGAVERIWFDLAKEFAARGHRVAILASGAEAMPRREERDGVRIDRALRLRSTKRIAVNLAKDAAYSLRTLVRVPKADVVVTNCFWLPAMLAPLRRGTPVYVSVARVPKGQMGMYAATGVARLGAVSTAIARMIVEECPRAERIVGVVPNPIATDAFRPDPARRDPKVRTIVYTGRIHPEKGLPILLRAFRLLAPSREVRLRIVGPWRVEQGGGGEAFRDELQALGDGLPVCFEEPVFDRAALAAILQGADVYCYPSVAEKGEASPVAPLEAMGTGLVPVVSDLDQFRDYLVEGENGMSFDHRGPEAPKRLADKLALLLDDDALRARMGERAAATGARYSVAAVAEKYLEDFARLRRR